MASDIDDIIKQLRKELVLDQRSSDKETREFATSLASADREDLEKAAQSLKSKVEKYIRNYFDNYDAASAGGWHWSYKGSKYSYKGRTGQLLDSVLVEVDTSGESMLARVYFDESKTTRKSLWGGESVDIVDVLNDGYRVQRGWHQDIHHFGHFEGARFIEAAIMEARHDPMFDGVEIIYEPSGGFELEGW